MSAAPPYRALAGESALPLAPPFRSLGLRIDYYPLVAELAKLRAFCDAYLNFADDPAPVPETVGRFEPLAPFVYLMMCRHPRLVVAHDDEGWFSQRELSFGFPVGWYRRVAGAWVLDRWAFVNPFIYLDSPLGMGTGREVDGWPKKPAAFETTPRSLTMRCRWAATEGATARPATLLELTAGASTAPAAVWAQWSALQRGAMGSWAALGREVGPAVTPWVRAVSHPTAFWALWRAAVTGTLDTNVITLKQFRDAASPGRADYQALVHTAMQIDRVLDVAPLGGAAQLMGDPSGGHRVRIHASTTDPVVETLGLVVDRIDETEGGAVATLRPAFPFSVRMDITYPTGEVLCARTREGAWSTREGVAGASPGAPPRFNETLATSTLCRETPLRHEGVTAWVLRLDASRVAVAALCANYFGGLGPRFTPDDRRLPGDEGRAEDPARTAVYLVVSRAEVRSEKPAPLAWDERSATLLVPVRCDGAPAWIAPYRFCDNGFGHVTARELLGAASALGTVTGAWMGDDDPAFARAATELFAHADAGESATVEPVFEVHDRAKVDEGAAPAALDAIAAALGAGASVYAVKQYRDAAEPGRAAVQSLARAVIRDAVVTEASALPGSFEVWVKASANFDPILALGLRGKPAADGSGALVCAAHDALRLSGSFTLDGAAT